ncbi:hypothetical protein BD779DRAFT_1451849 [Infundibulicybe gibba]|nr:hypothetical protein BD779DRAFT_1451849 [Infundibulicybe gibba]
MAPYLGPQEPSSAVTLERYFLATDYVSGIGYGAQGVLYITCVLFLWRQRKMQHTYTLMLAYMTLLFLISSIAQVAQAHRTQLVFVENRNFPGGAWVYYEQSLGGVVSMVGLAANMGLLFLTELFMVLWRCWVVWFSIGRNAAYLVIVLPLLMLIVALTTGILFLFTLAHPASRIGGSRTLAWGSAYYTLMFSSNIVVTTLIIARLIAHRRRIQTSLALTHAEAYTSLITMAIESAALFSIIGLACLITYGVGSPVNAPFVSASISAQQISGYLLIVRLAHGQTWQKDPSMHVRAGVELKTSTADSQLGSDQWTAVLGQY